MSLMQLLTVTRSIKTVKNQPSPYKMKQDHLLPRFSAPRDEEEEQAETATPATPAAAGPAIVQKKNFFRRWFGFGRRKRHPRHLPVQTELLLEAVRVARNDFQESSVFSEGLRRREAPQPRTRTVAGQWWLKIQTRLFAQRRKSN